MNPDDLEQEDDRDEFDTLISSLAGPSEPEQPEPVTPEALSEPDDRAEFDSLIGGIAAQQPSAVPTEPTAPASPRPVVQQAPTVATRTGARFARGGAELGARGGEQGNLAEAEEQAKKERRRERILRGVGMGLSLVNPIIGGMISGGAGLVSTEGRRKEEILRDQLKQRGEMRAASERQRQEMLQRAVEGRRADRRLDLQEAQGRELATLRRDQLTQRGSQFEQQQGLRERRQGWQEEQAELDRDAKEVRARIIAGQRPVAGGTAQRPGSGSGGGGGPNVDNYLDAPVIRGFLSTRPEYLETAQQLAAESRESGQEADPNEIAWELASRGFQRLPRDEQDRIRRNFMSPETANSAMARPQREETQLNTRVRQYGEERQGQLKWERAVNNASRALGNVSDAEIRAAQQWLQGGAARQSISSALAPRAEQVGQAIAALQDELLKERSGAAVSDQEFARLRSELGTNWWSSPASLQRAIHEMRATNGALVEGLGATYGVDVVDAYERNRNAVRDHQRGAGGAQGGGRYQAGQVVTIGGRRVTLTESQAEAMNARGGR